MPSDDLVLNVRQVAGYSPTANAPPSSALLIQLGGLGGPYASISPQDLVSTALATGGDMAIAGALAVQSVSGGSAQFSNAAINMFSAQKACIVDFAATWGTVGGVQIATVNDVSALDAALRASTVWSFNGRLGDVRLWIDDIICAGGAPIFSPRFQGSPRAETPGPESNSSRLATTAFVQRNSALNIQDLLDTHPFVFSFNGRTGDVVLTPEDIGAVEGLLVYSPHLTGVPTTPTPPVGDNSTQIANSEFVTAAIAAAMGSLTGLYAPIFAPAFLGVPTALTAAPGTSTGQLATTAFVMNAVTEATAGVASFNTRVGAVVLEDSDLSDVGGALLASPIFTGTPSAPNAPPGTNTDQLATCAFVMNELGGVTSGVDSFNGRAGVVTLLQSDIVSAGGALLNSPIFTGGPQAPTAASGDSSNQLATTAFVENALNVNAGVISFMGRIGAITLTAADVSAAGGAPIVSPAFTGAPSGPTPPPGNDSTRLATTAYVAAAIAAISGVASFNSRTGAVTLTAADLSTPAVGGPFLPLGGGRLTGFLTMPAMTVSNNIANAINGPAGSTRILFGSTAGVIRWGLALGSADAESGANAGSDFDLWRYNDAGASLGAVMNIQRATGLVSFENSLGVNGDIAMNGQLNGCTNINAAGMGQIGGITMVNANLSTQGTVSAVAVAASGNFTSPVGTLGGVVFQGGGNFVSNGTLTLNTFSCTNSMLLVAGGTFNYGGYVLMTAGNLIPGPNNGVSCGLAGQAWFQCAAYNFAQQSDARGKRNIALASPGALEKVGQIPVHEFNYVEEKGRASRHIGWLAQEVQAVAPTNVLVGEDDAETLSVELGAMLATLWEAVQELTAKVATLEAKAA